MKQVASLQYGVIFKKAFGQVDIFKAFVKDVVGIDLEIDKVETEKTFIQKIGNVKVEFDCYAEDKKNRVIVEIQHENSSDHYDRFLHYHCVALLEQADNYENYRPKLTVYTIVVLTSGNKYKTDVATIDFDPRDKQGNKLNKIHHKIIYLAAKYVDENTPEAYQDWLRVINESLTETIDESHYSRPVLQKTIGLIEKNLITPEERYWLIEEYKAKEREKNAIKKVAKNLLEMGLALTAIEKATGLTQFEIENLSNEEFEDG